MKLPITIEAIDACLPQTQCGECDYDGCLPYAKAIACGDADIDRCPPGGLTTLTKLGQLLKKDITPFKDKVLAQIRPSQTVKIVEDICIGCTKCIQACPVDAIVGASKQMHTVITDECTGCELCIPPCPVDCIEIIPNAVSNIATDKAKADLARTRYQHRNDRFTRLENERASEHKLAKKTAHQRYIDDAIARVKTKKQENS